MTIILVALLRFLAGFLPSFSIDMNNWLAWAGMLVNEGIAKFYHLGVWTDYTPGFLYYLWLSGSLLKTLGQTLSPFWVKLPVILADLVTGLLIYQILKSRKNTLGSSAEKLAILGFLGYTLNPALVFTDSVWGQTDGILCLTLLLSAYFLSERKSLVWGWFFWAVSLLVKPQALAALPALFLFTFLKYRLAGMVKSLAVVGATLLVLGFPFFQSDPLFGLAKLIAKMSNESPFTSVMAFNFWAVAVGMWLPDSGSFVGITYYRWGFILLALAVGAIFARYWREKRTEISFYFTIGLIYLGFFLFSTRIHERYILSSLPFFWLVALLSRSFALGGIYGAISLLAFVNIYYPYAYYTRESFLSHQGLASFIASFIPGLSLLAIGLFFLLLFRKFKSSKFNLSAFKLGRENWWRNRKEAEENPAVIAHWKKIIALILVFAFVVRFWQLNQPPEFYFDEVYHAFTAREMLRGNPMAWEWWNTPPEGMAYEWTHPPLAKEGMWLGMSLLGERAIGWRSPGALLGTLSVFLVFLISRRLFDNLTIALISAGIFALDGLPLVMSRIGMNDSYFLFFTLLCFYLFLNDKIVASAVALGLAGASKWSTLWAIPILVTAHFLLRKKVKFSYLSYLFIPPAIYLASYIPMFLSGHSWDQFVEVQRQIWWYHTGLRATHPYTSPWWSWPLLYRGVWLYTSSVNNNSVANIYAFGNPFVFWAGLAAIIISIILLLSGLVRKAGSLMLVVFGYLAFFTPWALSPRIMFLYHYLPSIPFMAIATGYILRKFPSLILPFFVAAGILFFYFLPHWIGLVVPVSLDQSYYWFSSWR